MDRSILQQVCEAEALLSASQLCNAEEAQIAALREKLTHRRLTVSVIGQFKRGKSTLVNALLGQELLPTGIIPVTAAVTLIQYGEPAASVHFKNGKIQPVSSSELSDYISEQTNPDNQLGISHVTLSALSPFLKDGLTFVDTPGVGSIHKHNSEAAYAFVRESDAVIFLLSVDSPINEIEIDFLRSAKEYAGKFYFAVNKIDVVSEAELASYLDYCQKLLCSLMEVDSVMLFPLSARTGDGLVPLRQAISVDCAAAVLPILEESSRRKLKNIASDCLGQLDLYWKALNMPISRFHNRFAKMETEFRQLQERGVEDAARWKAQSQQLLQTFAQQLQEQSERWDFDDEELLRMQLSRIYDRQLTAAETLVHSVCEQLTLRENELKQQLSTSVTDLFGMEYHYHLTQLTMATEEMPSDNHQQRVENFLNHQLPQALDCKTSAIAAVLENLQSLLYEELTQLCSTFSEHTEAVCGQLAQTLNTILLYREEDTYTVAKRIDDLNKQIRHLKQLRQELQIEHEEEKPC